MPVSRYAFRAWGGSAGTMRVRDFLAAERSFRQRHDRARHAKQGRRAGHEQQIAGGLLDDALEPAAQPCGVPVRGRPRRAGVELDDERVEVVGISHRARFRRRR